MCRFKKTTFTGRVSFLARHSSLETIDQLYVALQVIGDTSGGETSKKLSQSRGSFEVLEEIQNVVGIPVKFVHIIANPFDVIASSLIKQSDSYNKVRLKMSQSVKTSF